MECDDPVTAFTEALTLDPGYALARATRALVTWECATNSPQWLQQPSQERVREDAEGALELAPGLPEAHVALASLELGLLNFAAADQQCARVLALAPGNERVLHNCSLLAENLGRAEAAISDARHAVALDPLNPLSHRTLGDALRYARRYDESIAAYQAAIATDPEHAAEAHALLGLTYYLTGKLALAQTSCEAHADTFRSRLCQAIVYQGLGRHADAAGALAKLQEVTRGAPDAAAYQYVEIYAQWGEHKAALDWLEKALRLRDPGLGYTKTDPLLDPIRGEPRFQAVERELKFPD
jgi:tetratricopeptide (TPR) repeat protein